jgi:hypothetical protein
MPIMTGEWRTLTEESAATAPATVGIIQLADPDQRIIDIQFVGAHATFGMRGVLGAVAAHLGQLMFRYEVNAQYLTRYDELLMVHHFQFGELPARNRDRGCRVPGRLHPSGLPQFIPVHAEAGADAGDGSTQE